MLIFCLMIIAFGVGDFCFFRLARSILRRSGWPRLAVRAVALLMAFQVVYLLFVVITSIWDVGNVEPPLAIHTFCYLWHLAALPIGLALLATLWVWFRIADHRRRRLITSVPDARDIADSGLSRRQALGALAAVPVVGCGIATGASLSDLSAFRIRRVTLTLANLPPALDGVTLTHLTDVHIGRFLVAGMLERVADAVNQLESDLVVLTGDLNDLSARSLKPGIDFVRRLRSRHGLAMIEGNHDVMADADRFEKGMKDQGMPLLLDESMVAIPRGPQWPIQLMGITWGELQWGRDIGREGKDRDVRFRVYSDQWVQSALRQLKGQLKPGAFPILLGHHPHVFDRAVAEAVPLTLAGHTHGGQIMLTPSFGAGPMRFRYWTGLYKRQTSQLFIANGLGNWFPLRLNAPQEIAQITLKSETG